jgi:hypothetical protein
MLSYKGDELKDPEKVRGFNLLSDFNKELFRQFIVNFYNAWEFPERHVPIKVALKRDKFNGTYIRVDFKSGDWYHVKGPYTWY